MQRKQKLWALLGVAGGIAAGLGACSTEPDTRRATRSTTQSEPLTLPSGFIEEDVGSGWSQAVGLTFAPDGRLYVWEKAGRVWEVDENGNRAATPLIDISEEVGDWRDYGLLGVALHPNFLSNGYIYLLYVVDYHHAKYFGTPDYDPSANQYFFDTIGRVTRYQAQASTGFQSVDPESRQVLLGETLQTGCPILHESHGVGSIVFGEDGTLLVSCGDGASYNNIDSGGATESNTGLGDGIIRVAEDVGAFRSQIVNSFSGKVLRLDPLNGDGVQTNPFFDPAAPRAPRSRVWSLGLRNPFKMTLRPGSGAHDPSAGDPGTLYIGDVGWTLWEELNIASAPGQNFGWPLYEGHDAHAGYVAADPGNQDAPNPLFGGGCSQQFFTFANLLKQETLNPLSFPNPCNAGVQIPASIPKFEHARAALDWRHGNNTTRVPAFNASGNAITRSLGAAGAPPGTPFSGSCSVGGVWYTGEEFPAEYRDTYFHADYVGGWIKNMVFDQNDNLVEVKNFAPAGGTPLVALAAHPSDGSLYYIAYANSVRRIRYVGGGNKPPVAVASSDLEYGASPLAVQFTGSESRDPELGPLSYSWNFGDGSPISTAANPTHVFDPGSPVGQGYDVELTVTDVSGASDTAELRIVVNDTPPSVGIDAPVNGGVFSVFGPSAVPLSAEVADAEQSSGSLGCSWQAILHHNEHMHPEPPIAGCDQSALVSPVSCGDEDYYFRFEVTVTDDLGLATRTSSVLYPDCTPTPIGPVGSVSPSPTFSWRRVLGADQYEIAVDDASGPGTLSLADLASAFGCGSGEPACSLDSPVALEFGAASFRVRAHNPVDGWRGWSQALPFTVAPPAGVCGDGVLNSGEECDDGNTVDSDGCRNNCTLPTCSDGAQNQGEAGVDCGGPCPACGTGCQSNPLLPVGASASSLESASYPASLAIDASPTTRWSSGFYDPQWLSVDLGAVRRIRRVTLMWEAAASADYDLQVADSATGPWTTIYTDGSGNGGTDDITGLNANGRFVRMYSRTRTTPWGNSLFDVRVYGDTNTGCGTPLPICGNGTIEGGEECDDGNTVNDDGCNNGCVLATCSDGLQNQGETGVDCGGPCTLCGLSCQSLYIEPVAASASSLESASYPASQATDGSLLTRWSSAFSDPQWIRLDLGVPHRIARVLLEWEDAASADYELQVADAAAGPWTTVFADPNGNGGSDDIDDIDVNARFVRMYSTERTTPWGNSLWEFQVFGDPNTSCGSGNPPVCGNGIVEAGEQCDDGNTVNDDACSNACVAATCSDGAQNQGEAGIDCGGPCSACVACGNGIVEAGEECDDGNLVDDDLCSNDCVAATCSDGIQNQGEAAVDCGGPCAACGAACASNYLTPAAVTASSVESGSLPASNAIDGSLLTRWSSAYSDPQWIAIDLGATRRIQRVLLEWEAAASADYEVQVADSASGPWTLVYADENGNGGSDDIDELNVNARFVRVYSYARTTPWGNSLWEFQVYGDTNTGCGTLPPACGNGVPEAGEQCDDGNTVDNDSCSNACIAATCTDGVQNQGEQAVDCGGPCAACGTQCQTLPLTAVAATASSVDSSSRPASLAIDASLTTRWSSAYSDPQWIVVDLGAQRRVRRVTLNWEFGASADYDIQVSSSASGPWTTLYTDANGNGGIDDITGLNSNGRYVRMYSRSRTSQWGNSLWDFKVYGDVSTTCSP